MLLSERADQQPEGRLRRCALASPGFFKMKIAERVGGGHLGDDSFAEMTITPALVLRIKRNIRKDHTHVSRPARRQIRGEQRDSLCRRLFCERGINTDFDGALRVAGNVGDLERGAMIAFSIKDSGRAPAPQRGSPFCVSHFLPLQSFSPGTTIRCRGSSERPITRNLPSIKRWTPQRLSLKPRRPKYGTTTDNAPSCLAKVWSSSKPECLTL